MMKQHLAWTLVIFLLTVNFAYSSDINPTVSAGELMDLNIRLPEYNKAENRREYVRVRLYDLVSKKFVMLHLEETSENSGRFIGKFSVELGNAVVIPTFMLVRGRNLLKNLGFSYKKEKNYTSFVLSTRKGVKKLPSSKELLERALKKMAEEEEKKRKRLRKLAQKKAEDGKALLEERKFVEAEKTLREAVALNAVDSTLYYKLGVSLFYQKKYSDALSEFKKSTYSQDLKDNGTYYQALCLYQLKEYNDAEGLFGQVMTGKEERLKPTTSFYRGIIAYKNEKFKNAKSHFEYVVESKTSDDLKFNSHKYLEYIERKLEYQRRLGKWFSANATVGLFQYDTNIVSLPSDTISNQAGVGFSWALGGGFYPLRNKRMELAMKYDWNVTYHPESSFVAYDLWMHTVTVPYSLNFKIKKHPVKLSFTPGYAMMMNDTSKFPPRNRLMQSITFNTSATALLSRDDVVIANLNYKNDKSFQVSSAIDDSGGNGIILGGTYVHFLNVDKTKNWLAGSMMDIIVAKGDNYHQFKFTGFGGITWPIYWDISGTGKFTFFVNKYTKHASNRMDEQMKFDISFKRMIIPRVMAMQSFSYTQNFSNISTSKYGKFVMTTSLMAYY